MGCFFHPQTHHKAGAFPGKKETCCNFALNRIPAEARIQIVKTVIQGGTDILSVNSKHRPEACATIIIPPEEVREQFKRVKPLKEIGVKERGWTLDVLNAVRRVVGTPRCGVRTSVGLRCRAAWPSSSSALPKQRSSQRDDPTNTFTTSDVYALSGELEKLHPDNSESLREQAGLSAIKFVSNSKSCAMSVCHGKSEADSGGLPAIHRNGLNS